MQGASVGAVNAGKPQTTPQTLQPQEAFAKFKSYLIGSEGTTVSNKHGGGSGKRFNPTLEEAIKAKKQEVTGLKVKTAQTYGAAYAGELGVAQRELHDLETAQDMKELNGKYQSYYTRPDFATRSAYKPKSVQMRFAPNVNTHQEWQDIIYNGIHDISTTYSNGQETWATSQIRHFGYDQLTPEEKQLYAYLYDESPELAQTLLEELRPALLYRRGKTLNQQYTIQAQDSPLGTSAKSFATKVMTGLMYPGQLIAGMIDPNLSPHHPVFDYNYQTDAYRSGGRQALGQWLGNDQVGGILYDGLMLGGDLAVARYAGKGAQKITGSPKAASTVSAGLMASQGGSQDLLAGIQQGLTAPQAADRSMLNAGIELCTSHFTFEELLSHPGQTVKRLAAIADKAGAAQAAGEIAKIAGDILISGDRAALIQEYHELCKTMPPRQATREMFRRYGQRLARSHMVGALGGGLVAGAERFRSSVSRKLGQPRSYWEESVKEADATPQPTLPTHQEPPSLPQASTRALPGADLRDTIKGSQPAQAGYKPKLGVEGYSRQTYTGQAWTMEYKPKSGVSLTATPGKTTTILGRYLEDTQYILAELQIPKGTDFEMNMQGFNLLNTPDHLFRSPGQFRLQYNKPFLDAAIARGDIILMATPPEYNYLYDKYTNDATGLGWEYDYLCKHGYYYDNGRMIKED